MERVLDKYIIKRHEHHTAFVKRVFIFVICMNVISFLIFWIAYSSSMGADNQSEYHLANASPFLAGFYLSATTQSTVGGTTVKPVGALGTLMVGLQSLTTLALFLGAILIVSTLAHD
jgi:hypothetical protein